MLNEFKKFVLRGNLVDLAIGFTVGAAFSTVAKSIVNDAPLAFTWPLSAHQNAVSERLMWRMSISTDGFRGARAG